MESVNIYRDRHHGFSLIEMVIVISVIAIIGITSFMHWTGTHINVGGQAKQLASDITYAQSLAMTKGVRYYLIITGSNTYQIRNANGTAQQMALGNTTTTLNTGITFGTVSNLPNNLICFDGKGAPYTTSTLPGTVLTSTASIALVTDSSTRTVSIAPITGNVSVS